MGRHRDEARSPRFRHNLKQCTGAAGAIGAKPPRWVRARDHAAFPHSAPTIINLSPVRTEKSASVSSLPATASSSFIPSATR